MDCSFLPPCFQVLKQKIERTNLIAGKWISSVLPNPPEISPIRSGWILDNEGLYKINWFEGNMSPRGGPTRGELCFRGHNFGTFSN